MVPVPLATEKMTDASRKNVLKDKYDGGTVTNPEAKEYRINAYRTFIDSNYSKYIKTGSAAEFEKLYSAAKDYSLDQMKKKYKVKKVGDVPDLEYNISVPEYSYTPQTYSTTYDEDGTVTPYVIPEAQENYTDEQKSSISKYGLVPKK